MERVLVAVGSLVSAARGRHTSEADSAQAQAPQLGHGSEDVGDAVYLERDTAEIDDAQRVLLNEIMKHFPRDRP